MRSARLMFVPTLFLGLLIATIVATDGAGAAGGGRIAAKSPGNPTATPAPTATAVPCPTCPTMYVDTVNINAWYDSGSRTLNAGCYVTVKDEAGNWVENAAVTIRWGGQLSGTAVALTAPTGEGGYTEAYFFKSAGGRCRSGETRLSSCDIVNVYKDGMAYDPGQNLQVTDSDNHCN